MKTNFEKFDYFFAKELELIIVFKTENYCALGSLRAMLFVILCVLVKLGGSLHEESERRFLNL